MRKEFQQPVQGYDIFKIEDYNIRAGGSDRKNWEAEGMNGQIRDKGKYFFPYSNNRRRF